MATKKSCAILLFHNFPPAAVTDKMILLIGLVLSILPMISGCDGGSGSKAALDLSDTGLNTAPVAVAGDASTDEDTPAALTLTAMDTDEDALTFSIVTGPTNGSLGEIAEGAVTYTPNLDFNGADSFTFMARDESLESEAATFTITVNAVNDAPVITGTLTSTTDEDTPVVITLTATDVDGDTLTYSIPTGPASGSLGAITDGSVTYTPGQDFNGTDSFTFTAEDQSLESAPATAEITINAINDAPAITGTPGSTVDTEEEYAFLPASSDPDSGDILTYSIAAKPAWAAFDTASGAFTGTPGNDDAGSHSGITITVQDAGGLTDSLPAFTIDVVDKSAPGSVTGLKAFQGDGVVRLQWSNPVDADFKGVMIRRDTTGFPATETDGTMAANLIMGGSTFDHVTGSDTNFFYSVFAYDQEATPNWAPGTRSAAYYLLGHSNGTGAALGDVLYDAGGENDTNGYGMEDMQGMAVDPVNHRLFVADDGNDRIQVFNLDANNDIAGRKAAFVIGQADFHHNDTNRGGPAAADTVDTPRGLNFYNDGSQQWLLSAEKYNHRVLIYNVTGGISTGMAAVTVLGQADFTSDLANRVDVATGCSDVSINAGTLNRPKEVMVGDVGALTLLFVSDTDNNRVLAWDITIGGIAGLADGQNADYVIGQLDFQGRSSNRCPGTVSSNTLDDPIGLALWNNWLLMADYYNDRVLAFDLGLNADNLTVVGPGLLAATQVLGQTDMTGSSSNQGGAVAANTFYHPAYLAVDGDYLYVADHYNNRVVVYNLGDGITTNENAVYVYGQPDFISSADNAAINGLDWPRGVVTAPGRLFISETGTDRVTSFDTGNLAADIGATAHGPDALNLLGQTDWRPGMAPGTENPIFTADGSNDTGAIGLQGPKDVTAGRVQGVNYIFVADNSSGRVLIFAAGADKTPPDLQADYVIGQPDYDHDNTPTSVSSLASAKGVAFDQASHMLFVTDNSNGRVMVFDLSLGITSGMAASAVLGQADFTSGLVNGGGAVGAGGFDGPRLLAVGTVGNTRYLFVAEKWNQRVLLFNISDGITTNEDAAFVLGQANFTSVNTTPSQAIMGYAYGVEYDPGRQWLFVAEADDDVPPYANKGHRVLIFDLSSGITNGMAATYVLGQPDFTTTTPSTTSTGFDYPQDVGYDPVNDRLFVVDSANNRVMIFNLADGVANGDAADAVLGQPDFVTSTAYVGSARTGLTMDWPGGIFVHPNTGLVLLTQEDDNRVLIFRPAN